MFHTHVLTFSKFQFFTSIGAILGAVSVKHMSDSLKQIESTADNILSDIGTFLDGGANVRMIDFHERCTMMPIYLLAASEFHSNQTVQCS